MKTLYIAMKTLLFLGGLFLTIALILVVILIWNEVLGYNVDELRKYAAICSVTGFSMLIVPALVLLCLEWF